jgi:uncharacterized repeat protein (TIGR01451 family)
MARLMRGWPRPRSPFRRPALATALVGAALAVLLIPGSLRAATETGADIVVVDLSDARAAIGTPYTYAYEVTNNGPEAATGVEFSIAIHGSFTFSSVSPDVGTCAYTSATDTADCAIGALAAGQSATVEIAVDPLGQMDAAANATRTVGEDPDASNNGAESSPKVLPAGSADLWVYPNSGLGDQGFGSAGYAVEGQPYDYSVDVVNYGPAVAEDVTLSLVLPPGADFDSADADCTMFEEDDGSGELVTCQLGTVATGRTVTVTAIAPLDAAGQTIQTAVFVDGSGPDPGPEPNDSSNQLVVVPGLSAADAAGSEADGVLEVPVELSQPVSDTVTVDYATTDETAEAGLDYTPTEGTLTISPGETSQVVSIPVTNDKLTEKNETFAVVLSNVGVSAAAEGAEAAIPTAGLVQPEAIATILDNDPKIRIGDVRVREGNRGASRVAFRITLSHASPDAVTARFATKNGTALAGRDYVARTLTVRFAPGQVTKTMKVSITGDRKNESNERFFALLSRIHGGIAADTRGKAVIVDND